MRFCTHTGGTSGTYETNLSWRAKSEIAQFFHIALETAMTGEAKKTTKSTDIKETRKAWKGKKL